MDVQKYLNQTKRVKTAEFCAKLLIAGVIQKFNFRKRMRYILLFCTVTYVQNLCMQYVAANIFYYAKKIKEDSIFAVINFNFAHCQSVLSNVIRFGHRDSF